MAGEQKADKVMMVQNNLLSSFAGVPRENEIYHCDALTLLRAMPDASVDLIVTSPPYNLNMRSTGSKWNPKLNAGYENHLDNMPHASYVRWQREIITEMLKTIKPSGAIFYNHKWRIRNGILDMRNDIVAGFPVRQCIIWQRNGGLNFNRGYFVPTFEVIYMLCGRGFELQPHTNAYGDVWRIGQEQNNEHPAPYPESLAERVIISASNEGDLILDPFMGSGTTAVAAHNLNRRFIGCDISLEYVETARKRLQNTDPYRATVHDNGMVQRSLFEETA